MVHMQSLASARPDTPYTAKRVARPHRARRQAASAILLMLAYVVVTNHLPLYPWNNLVSPQGASTAACGPFLIYAAALLFGWRWLMLIGTGHIVVWLALQLRQWWLPYLLGPTPIHRDFSWHAAHGYDRTLKLLPVVEGRPVPDAQHLVLQLISLVVMRASSRALWLTMRREA